VATTQRVGLEILGAEYFVGCGWILIENREGFLCHFTSFLGYVCICWLIY
jgi:hypothetical protein